MPRAPRLIWAIASQVVETATVEAVLFIDPLLPFPWGEAAACGREIHWGRLEVATVVVGRVRCGGRGGMGYHSGHWCSISLVGPGGTVGLSPSCAKLHIALLDMSDVSGPVLREILGAQDILELFAEATMEGSPFRGIIPL
jgi:hypothetical protein